MNEAKTTWALVVGIDEYDSPKLGRLKGAVADAVAAVAWLRSLGVPDQQILLHAAPSEASKPPLDALGLAYGTAREPEIWDSIAKLLDVTGGTRLFVFFSGHGLYEAASGRLFLTQEAGMAKAWPNLGMDAYGELFRSMAFARQFLFLDGCQNYPYPETERPRIVAAMHTGVAVPTPRIDTSLVACYAAGQGQRALEIDGRGLFLRHLLGGLALQSPCSAAIDLDFATGARTLDLRELFDVCRQRVTREASQQTPPRQQNPDIAPSGGRSSDRLLPIVRLPDLPTAELRVEVSPAAAASDLQRLRIFADEPPQWDLNRPTAAFPDESIGLPLVSRLPLGIQATARLVVRPQAPWTLADDTRSFAVDADRTLTFTMTERAVLPGATRGATRGAFETGVDDADEGDDGGLSARRTYALDDDWPKRGYPVEVDEPSGRPNLRLLLPPGGADALAGWLADLPVVWIGPPAEAPLAPSWCGAAGRLTLKDLERFGGRQVEPGPIRVQIDLPWGSWSRTVAAPAAGEVAVELPEVIGEPPLRVVLREQAWPQPGASAFGAKPPGFEILGLGNAAPVARLSAGLDDAAAGGAEMLSGLAGPEVWALRFEAGRAPFAVATLGGGLPASFPIVAHRALAVDRSRGGLRVEPLSDLARPAWDLLVAKGRLDALSAEDARELTRGKWQDWLLGLAGAYAIWANPAGQAAGYAAEVLANLGQIADLAVVPDLDLLRLALAGDDRDAQAQRFEALRRWAEAGAVPVFRWGVPLALRLLAPAADREPFAGWRKALARIERTLSPISTWTAWTREAPSSILADN